MSETVISLKEISKDDLDTAGGKGANLGEMINTGFPVPKGFCITTKAFDDFFNMSNLYVEIHSLLKEIDYQDTAQLEKQCEIIRDKIKSKKLPNDIYQKIKTFLSEYSDSQSFAVRSSATAEDLPDNSFAGQQDTYLNVIGFDEICNSVISCFASLYNARAVSYRIKNSFEHAKIRLAVIVQEQIFSDFSGVMFTVDPISENRNILSINACFGLGESLVSGLVNADLYKLNKNTNLIIEKDIQKKELLIKSTKQGVIKETVAQDLQLSQVIDDNQILDLAELGKKIESHYQMPQDIEWAIYKNKLYITQSRPITTLYPLPKNFVENNSELKIYLSINHLQVMTETISPLGKDIFSNLLPFFTKEKDRKMLHIGGRIYAELNDVLHNNLTRKILSNFLKVADQQMALGFDRILKDEKFNFIYRKSIPLSDFKFLRKNILKPNNLITVIGNILNPEKQVAKKYLDYIEEKNSLIKVQLNKNTTSKQKFKFIKNSTPNIFKWVIPYAIKMVTGAISFAILQVLLKNKIDKQYFNQFSSGSEENVTTKMNLELGDIADIIKKNEYLYNYFIKTPAQDIFISLENIPEAKEFNFAFKDFIQKYGMRGQGEIDIAKERWKENPMMLIQIILGNLSDKEIGKHRIHFKNQQHLSQEAENIILEQSKKGIFGFIIYPLVKKLCIATREYMSIREHHKFFIVKILSIYKQGILEIATYLKEKKLISQESDIFYLYFDEIDQCLDNKNIDVKSLIEQRKKDFERYAHLNPPRILTSEGEKIIGKKDKSQNKNELSGNAVSSGIVEGIARVIFDPQKEVLKSGEILVTRFTDPAWTPLFIHAKALITEVGGLMTHGSVIAREYGIPAVVGVENATSIIKTGQKLRVDGDSGIIEIIG
ncbi:MAG: phosphoenolpyruvate synthase [Candidatus Sericytochromatia bacterium]|nr:phosphoenolpyruvate synthase [Candidatus Sericytochromatia bacterium]